MTRIAEMRIRVKISFLIDNLTEGELKPEWGLAVHITYGGKRYLLDTGSSGKFAENAAAMGIALDAVDYGILSHAHYDHSDGMAEFFAQNKRAKFYLRAGTEENCYTKKGIFRKYIGIHKGYLKRYAGRFVYADGNYELSPGVLLLPHSTPQLDKRGKAAGMYVRKNHRMCPDCFEHEQSLAFDAAEGLVVFNSCSHGGADNIINEAKAACPGKKIYALIGGFHLFASPEQEVRALARRIEETGIAVIYTGHCTGRRATAILQEELGEKVKQIYTGLEIEIAE